MPTRRPRKTVPSDDEDLSPDLAQADDEVAAAYATLAEFHAQRGEFEQAESLATAASALGDSTGLVTLSWELLQRGDHANAERLALCAVNMVDTRRWVSPDQEPTRTLAEARGDATLLAWDSTRTAARPDPGKPIIAWITHGMTEMVAATTHINPPSTRDTHRDRLILSPRSYAAIMIFAVLPEVRHGRPRKLGASGRGDPIT